VLVLFCLLPVAWLKRLQRGPDPDPQTRFLEQKSKTQAAGIASREPAAGSRQPAAGGGKRQKAEGSCSCLAVLCSVFCFFYWLWLLAIGWLLVGYWLLTTGGFFLLYFSFWLRAKTH
jgi:hypothetical protein